MKFLKNYKKIFLFFTLIFLGSFKVVNAYFAWWFAKEVTSVSWGEIILAIGTAVLWLTSQILRIAGILFNFVMDKTINFSELVSKTGVVDVGWTIFRDLSNMVFIFILLAISIATILGIQSYGAKNLLKKVILVALLINFSLFASQAVIDSANVFTVGFYNALTEKGDTEGINKYDKGISAIFASALDLQTLYDDKGMKQGDQNGNKLNAGNILIVTVMGSTLIIVTAFVFFAGAVLLMKRMVILMFLMILSPFAFLGMILPATAGYSKQWWITLFKESFYAPLFMMFIYVVAKAITTDTSTNVDSFTSIFTGGTAVTNLFNFVLVIGLMLASLIVAAKLATGGAKGVTKLAGKASFGLASFAGKQTLGRAMRPIRDKVAKTKWAQKEGFGSKLALKTLDSSFDIRNIKPAQDFSKSQGIDIGTPAKKGGYATGREKSVQSTYKYTEKMTDTEREAYANKETNIFARMAGTGRSTAVENIRKEYAAKRDWEGAQANLTTAQNAPGVSPAVIATRQQNVADAKKRYEVAKAKTKPKKDKKDKKDKDKNK